MNYENDGQVSNMILSSSLQPLRLSLARERIVLSIMTQKLSSAKDTSSNNYSLFPRPKPEKKIVKPIEQPVVERKPPEPYNPKPMIRKLPARKLSDTISLTMSITYAFLETYNESPLISL